jgi:phosphocarrier protein
MLSRKIIIRNQSGLHMRPAGVFVKACMPFKSDVLFDIRGNTYNGKSMIKILSATDKSGDEIELRIDGEDEESCMDAIVAAIESGLGEEAV